MSMVEEIVTLRMAGKFEEETVVSDMNEQRALSMADYMAAGIIKQFTL